MAVTNNKVYLLKNVPLMRGNENTFDFSSAAAQQSYFYNKRAKNIVGTYQKATNEIRVNAAADDVIDCSYCMWQNSDYSGKWYYAFVENVEFINSGMCKAKVYIDAFQTYMFDMDVPACFVEREHVTDDTIGKHTLPENIDVGEYLQEVVWSSGLDTTMNTSDLITIVAATVDIGRLPTTTEAFKWVPEWAIPGYEYLPDWLDSLNTISPENTYFDNVYTSDYNGMISGVAYFAVKDTGVLTRMMQLLEKAGQISSIQSIFKFPRSLVLSMQIGDVKGIERIIGKKTALSTVKLNKTLGSYSPRNNKMYNYPFTFYRATNLQGQILDYQPENVEGDELRFELCGVPSENTKIMLIPEKYLQYTGTKYKPIDYSLSLPSMPLGSWNNDVYTAYYAQNQNTIAYNTASNVVNMAASAASGNVGGVVSGLASIGSMIAEREDRKKIPPSVSGNVGSNTTLMAYYNYGFEVHHYYPRPEYCAIIDGFLDMYGYSRHTVKKPNLKGRPTWNYTKTVNAIVTGNFPQEYKTDIANRLDAGIRIWHNPNNIGNYALANK